MENNYYVGLDLGEGAIGWAVTDKKYEIVRAHGNALWGVRLFDVDTGKKERNINWNRYRVDFLQEIFGMKRKAPSLGEKYQEKFPSIYHLRKYLMDTEETPEVCLIYLALRNIMKQRGHFQFEGEMEDIRDIACVFRQFFQMLRDAGLNFHMYPREEDYKEAVKILRDGSSTKMEKKEMLNTVFGAYTPCEKAIMALLTGNTVRLNDIFDRNVPHTYKRPKVSFSSRTYGRYAEELKSELGEDYLIVEMAKAIYDWIVLSDMLGESDSISEARIAVYNKHKKDLEILKTVVANKLDQDVYRSLFHREDGRKTNYSMYIGKTRKSERKSFQTESAGLKKDFYAYLKKNVLNKLPECSEKKYIEREMKKGDFLPKAVLKDTGAVPYQVHLYELTKIIKNLRDKVPVLDKYGEYIFRMFVMSEEDLSAASWEFDALVDRCKGMPGMFREAKPLLVQTFPIIKELCKIMGTQPKCIFLGEKNESRTLGLALKWRFPDLEITYINEKSVSNLKKEFAITEVRKMNVFFHAKDAYLNSVIGRPHSIMFSKDCEADRILENIIKNVNKTNILVTKSSSRDDTGVLFALVDSDGPEGKRVRTIEEISGFLGNTEEYNREAGEKYLAEKAGLKHPRIIMPAIKKDTLFKVNGAYLWLSGKVGKQLQFQGADQLLLSGDDAAILEKVLEYTCRSVGNAGPEDDVAVDTLELVRLYDVFLNKVKTSVYHVGMAAEEKTLTEKREKFLLLSDKEKCVILSEILKMFQCRGGTANLELIGGLKTAGKRVLDNNISELDRISVLYQSSTGLYAKEINLKNGC